MNILVTGGCGFIGSHITDRLTELKHNVCVVDDLSGGKIENLNPCAVFHKIDIRSKELEAVFESFKPEIVFHEAAQISMPKSLLDPINDTSRNLTGTVNLLECCRKHRVKKIIYASSAAVYGEPDYLGIDEYHACKPLSPYGLSKLTAEEYIKLFSKLYGLKYTILRYANVYGIRQEPTGEGGVISILTEKLMKKHPFDVYGDGEQTRDYVYVKDIVGANIAAMTKADGETINAGTGEPVTITELIRCSEAVSGIKLDLHYLSERKGDIVHSRFNIQKMNDVLGYSPEYSLEKGLKEIYDYYL